jgi:hypothetical protein
MKTAVYRSLLFAALALSAAASAQQPTPPPVPRGHPGAMAPMHAPDGYMSRLDRLLRESREKRARVVLRIYGEEVAGVVQDLGPGWVVLSNQEGQQILLQTQTVERAEIR